MARVIFENLTEKQALEMAEWFEGQGEQDMYGWFDCNRVEPFSADVGRKGGYKKKEENGDITVFCKT
jgi:hypothetical protein